MIKQSLLSFGDGDGVALAINAQKREERTTNGILGNWHEKSLKSHFSDGIFVSNLSSPINVRRHKNLKWLSEWSWLAPTIRRTRHWKAIQQCQLYDFGHFPQRSPQLKSDRYLIPLLIPLREKSICLRILTFVSIYLRANFYEIAINEWCGI